MQGMSYWQRLHALGIYSLERRRDRYTILYTYKVILEIAPNFDDDRFKIKTVHNVRRGLLCIVPPINTVATMRIKTIVEHSFAIRAPRLFNCVPKSIRSNNLSYEAFKSGLDKFLDKVPDLPSLTNYAQRAASNSLSDQVVQLKRDGVYFM